MEHVSDYAADFVKERQQQPCSFTGTAPCERAEGRLSTSSIWDSGSQSLLACISRLEEKGSFVSSSCPAQSLDSEELG